MQPELFLLLKVIEIFLNDLKDYQCSFFFVREMNDFLVDLKGKLQCNLNCCSIISIEIINVEQIVSRTKS